MCLSSQSIQQRIKDKYFSNLIYQTDCVRIYETQHWILAIIYQ